MRRLAPKIAFLTLALCANAVAAPLLLREPVELRARPHAVRGATLIAPAGAELDVAGRGREWVPVVFGGRRYFAPAAQLAAASPSDEPSPDPTCDYGYPYSGSNVFFTRPLARLRHGEPLGFLFGQHRFYPC
jgi:hypothetical protein